MKFGCCKPEAMLEQMPRYICIFAALLLALRWANAAEEPPLLAAAAKEVNVTALPLKSGAAEPPKVEAKMAKTSIEAAEEHSKAGAGAAAEDTQSRHAYLVHHYGGGGGGGGSTETLADATPPPLYQLLQQQMEQVLAATGADYGVYPSQKKYKLKDAAAVEVMQIPPKKPQFSYNGEDADDYGDETEAELETDDEELDDNLPAVAAATYGVHAAQVKPHRTASTTKRPYAVSSKPASSAASSSTTSTTKAPAPAAVKPKTPEPAPLAAPPQKYKRRITFKTVSTSSHFVSTPLADLMLKFSIGVAPPSHQDYGESLLPLPSTAYQQNGIEAKSAAAATYKLDGAKIEPAKRHRPAATHAPKHKNVKTRKPKVLDISSEQ